MKIVSIEPTPSPNSMKLNLDEKLHGGLKFTYTQDNKEDAPAIILRLLSIQGVKSIFHAADFMAIDRIPKFDWQSILAEVREAFGQTDVSGDPAQIKSEADVSFGEVKVLLQQFRGLPIQVRVSNDTEELRSALPERFNEAVMKATASQPFLIKERKLIELDVRYGDLQQVLAEVVQEIDAAYDEKRLDELTAQALTAGSSDIPAEPARHRRSVQELAELLNHPDWKVRYGALGQIEPSLETLPLLVQALRDNNTSMRRLASVYIGEMKEPEALPYLFEALKDDNASVRRTVGDTLSDLGDPAAIRPMAEALQDPNKLVRWRAARFLYEAGDESVLEALRKAQSDPEFEVAMQVKMALERIEGGHEATGSVWQQMTQARQ